MKNIIIYFLIGFVCGILLGFFVFKKPDTKNQNTITARTVIVAVKEQGFLVTRTVYLEPQVKVTIDKGSDWSNFWWGQEIKAKGQSKVDIGVDLTKIQQSDISINKDTKIICINLPNASINTIALEGDIEVQTKNGILKKLLANNPNKDFNLANEKIKEESRIAVESKKQLFTDSQNATKIILQTLFSQTDYKVEVNCR